jgi:hypothetical protein
MKKLIQITFLLIFFQSWAQDMDRKKLQEEWFKKAELCLQSGDLNCASGLFMHSSRFSPESDLGIIALKKVDSIEPLRRKALISQIKGTWKIKRFGSNWGMKEQSATKIVLLKINEAELVFIEKDSATKIEKTTKIEKITFSKTDLRSHLSLDLSYSDGSFWNFYVNDKNELNVTYTGEKNESGRTEMVCGNQTYIYEKVE